MPKSRTHRLVSIREDARFDAVSFLTVYVVILFAVPSQLVVGSLGSAGSPANIIGLIGLLWWIWDRLHRSRQVDSSPQPVRAAMALFIAAVLASFVVAMMRAINAEEARQALASLISLGSWFGVVLIANDGVLRSGRLLDLLRRLTFAGGALATLGLFQFITKQSWVDSIYIPGLSANQALAGSSSRAGFTRPAGTAIHPIEFGAVLTMILPIALTSSLANSSRTLIRRWFPPAIIGLAITLSISRSAVVGAAIGLLVLIPAWPAAARRVAVASIVGLMTAVFVAVPGVLGSVTGLFTSIGGDSSAQSRTGSYPIALDFFGRSPLFGRGFGTFLPKYRIFDNQYLGLLVEVGLVGLLAFLALVITAANSAIRARRLAKQTGAPGYEQALLAAIITGGCSEALFDGFGFPMNAGLLFLLFGLAGATLRLATASTHVNAPLSRSEPL